MLFYVSTCKNTNKLRISHTFSQEKTKTERIEIDFEQKKHPPPLHQSKNGGMFIHDTIFHSRQFTSSFTEKFKPIFTTFLPLILKASA